MNRVTRRLKTKKRLFLLALSLSLGSIGVCMLALNVDIKIPALLLLACVCCIFLFAISFFYKDFCVIHPYFSKKLSMKSPDTAFEGKEIASRLDELDDYLHLNNMQSISDFGYQQTNPKKMHDPEKLLKSLNFLVQNNLSLKLELKMELHKWIEKINVARNEGALVAIHIRTTDGVSGLEIDRLQGTY